MVFPVAKYLSSFCPHTMSYNCLIFQESEFSFPYFNALEMSVNFISIDLYIFVIRTLVVIGIPALLYPV